MKKYYKLIIILLVISFLVPQMALASWWNPFSWFGSKNSAPKETETQTQQLEQNASDQSATIEQLNKTIAELEKQLAEYKCPACVSGATQCPECKPQIITKEVPVEKIVQSACPICPTCQEANTTSKNLTPLTASCSIKTPVNLSGGNISYVVEPSGGTGDGVYYYTWKDYAYMKITECGTTVNPVCSIPSSSTIITSTNSARRGVVFVEVRSGEQTVIVKCSTNNVF